MHRKNTVMDTINITEEVDIRLVYMYSSYSESAERSPESRNVIPLILEEYGIRSNYYFINVTDTENNPDQTLLDEYMRRHTNSIVLLVSALSSGLTNSTAEYLESRGYTNYLILNASSTLSNDVLNSPRVIRIAPRDGSNALLFKAVFDSVYAENKILLVDENNIWAQGLAEDIQNIIPDIVRYDLNDLVSGSAQLPQGTLSIIGLADPTVRILLDVLPERTGDIKLVLLGDADTAVSPRTTQELEYLTAWNTKVIVPRTNTTATIGAFVDRTGYTNISNTLGPVVSILQLAAYLKYVLVHDNNLIRDTDGRINALYLLPAIRNYYIGIGLDEETMDVISGIFTVVYFTEVGLPATAIDIVGVSLQEEDETVRMYIGQEEQP